MIRLMVVVRREKFLEAPSKKSDRKFWRGTHASACNAVGGTRAACEPRLRAGARFAPQHARCFPAKRCSRAASRLRFSPTSARAETVSDRGRRSADVRLQLTNHRALAARDQNLLPLRRVPAQSQPTLIPCRVLAVR